MHMDFMEVSTNQYNNEVPVVLEGHAEGKEAGGKLTLRMRKLKSKSCLHSDP